MEIKRAREVLRIESKAIANLTKKVGRNFKKALDMIYACRGKVVVTGMGKAGLIGQKLSSTLASIGTPSLYVHPADAVHGDLGRITKEDVIIALSNSGETEEITRLLPVLKKIGAKLIAFTGNLASTIAQNSDVVLDTGVEKEACPFGLLPTSSTTAMLAMGDALAVVLLDKKRLKKSDFAFFHPGGSIGKKLLLKIEDIMRKGRAHPVVNENELVKEVLLRITEARAGSATVVDRQGRLKGIFTDGDLRRHLKKGPSVISRCVREVMTKNPLTIKKGRLATEALQILRENKIDEIPVVDNKRRPIGLVDVQDLLKVKVL